MTQGSSHDGTRLQVGFAAQDYRASRARAYRRKDNAEAVEVCAWCGTETDVPEPVHASRCAAAPRPPVLEPAPQRAKRPKRFIG